MRLIYGCDVTTSFPVTAMFYFSNTVSLGPFKSQGLAESLVKEGNKTNVKSITKTTLSPRFIFIAVAY